MRFNCTTRGRLKVKDAGKVTDSGGGMGHVEGARPAGPG